MKTKLILIIIIALFLCAMLPRDVDDVRTQSATLTITPAMLGYPAPYYPAQIRTACITPTAWSVMQSYPPPVVVTEPAYPAPGYPPPYLTPTPYPPPTPPPDD